MCVSVGRIILTVVGTSLCVPVAAWENYGRNVVGYRIRVGRAISVQDGQSGQNDSGVSTAAQIKSRLLANLNRYSIDQRQSGSGLLAAIADSPPEELTNGRTGKQLFKNGRKKVSELHAANVIMPPLSARPEYVNRSSHMSAVMARDGAPTVAGARLAAASVDVRPMVLRKLADTRGPATATSAVTQSLPVVANEDRILSTRRPIKVLSSLAHDHDVDNDILPSSQSQAHAAAQFGGSGGSYVREQREYFRPPAISFASPQLQQPLTFFNVQQLEPLRQPPSAHGTVNRIPPALQQFQLLSEFAPTTAVTSATVAQTFAPSVYARETAALDDEYYEDELPAAAYERQVPKQDLPRPQSASQTSPRHEENTQMCNSRRLARVIREAAIAGDAEATKRAIQRRAERDFGAYYNVICGTGFFSYIAHTSEFCLAPAAGDLNCYVFAPTPARHRRRRRRQRTRRFYESAETRQRRRGPKERSMLP